MAPCHWFVTAHGCGLQETGAETKQVLSGVAARSGTGVVASCSALRGRPLLDCRYQVPSYFLPPVPLLPPPLLRPPPPELRAAAPWARALKPELVPLLSAWLWIRAAAAPVIGVLLPLDDMVVGGRAVRWWSLCLWSLCVWVWRWVELWAFSVTAGASLPATLLPPRCHVAARGPSCSRQVDSKFKW